MYVLRNFMEKDICGASATYENKKNVWFLHSTMNMFVYQELFLSVAKASVKIGTEIEKKKLKECHLHISKIMEEGKKNEKKIP